MHDLLVCEPLLRLITHSLLIKYLTLHEVGLLGHLLSAGSSLGIGGIRDGTGYVRVWASVVRAEIVAAGATAASMHGLALTSFAAVETFALTT